MIRWGSSSFRPSNGQRQGINPPRRQNILSPLEGKTPGGLVWGSVIMNVQKDEEVGPPVSPTPTPTASGPPPSPSQTPTLTPTQTQTTTPTPTVTSTETPTPTPTPTGTPTSVSELEYIVYAESGSNVQTYTFSNTSYGGSGLIIVGMHANSVETVQSVSGITIGGNLMTQVVLASSTNAIPWRSYAGLYQYRMTGGTSADIVVRFNANPATNCAISVWRLTGNTSDTAFSTDTFTNNTSGTSADIDLNLNTGRNHIVAIQTLRDTDSSTWTNATEEYDLQIASETARASGAEGFFIGSGTTNISTSFTTAAIPTMVGATWN
jgi:hypothetical protein